MPMFQMHAKNNVKQNILYNISGKEKQYQIKEKEF